MAKSMDAGISISLGALGLRVGHECMDARMRYRHPALENEQSNHRSLYAADLAHGLIWNNAWPVATCEERGRTSWNDKSYSNIAQARGDEVHAVC